MDKKIDSILDALYEKHDLHLFGSHVESQVEVAIREGVRLGIELTEAKLTAENARLREALEQISQPTSMWDGFSAKLYWNIAREALKGGE
jgi:hypothetical protein